MGFKINQHVMNFFWVVAVPSVAAFGYYMAYAPSKEQLAADLVCFPCCTHRRMMCSSLTLRWLGQRKMHPQRVAAAQKRQTALKRMIFDPSDDDKKAMDAAFSGGVSTTRSTQDLIPQPEVAPEDVDNDKP